MKTWQKIALGVVAVVAIAAGAFIFMLSRQGANIDPAHLPKFVQADFVELSKIYSVSKFRSGEGHDFSGGGETCRSMKHYFYPQFDMTAEAYRKDHNGMPPPPANDATDITIYSPVDGTITEVQEEQMPIGKQVFITPDAAPEFTLRLFHVYLTDGIGKGKKVKAGEKIGVIGKNQTTDISVQYGPPWSQNLVSYFDVMPDNIFAAYQARGVSSRSNAIISKAERDASPLQCDGEQFKQSSSSSADSIRLSGYIDPQKDFPKN